MKKTGILLGLYLIASLSGALTGALVWADPFRTDDILGFMMMAPLFQFVSLLTGFNTKNVALGALLLLTCGGAVIASVIGYYRSRKRWPLATFAIPVFMASLQGAELVCEAIAA